MWSSDKLAACEVWARREYAWLYPLADANGCFEFNLRVVWGRVAAIRPDLTQQRLAQVFEEFRCHGLLFTWTKNGKTYAHWTRSESRLPPKSERSRHKSLAPELPGGQLSEYLKSFGRQGNGTNPLNTTNSFEMNEVSNVHDPGLDLVQVQVQVQDKTFRQKPAPSLPGFEIFFEAYPVGRRISRSRAVKCWLRNVRDDSRYPEVIAALEMWKHTEQWEDSQYIPLMSTFLNQRRWEDEVPKGGGSLAERNDQAAKRTAEKHGLKWPN